jgi:DNA-directed RNA polymerase subunit E'/Rpb7
LLIPNLNELILDSIVKLDLRVKNTKKLVTERMHSDLFGSLMQKIFGFLLYVVDITVIDDAIAYEMKCLKRYDALKANNLS